MQSPRSLYKSLPRLEGFLYKLTKLLIYTEWKKMWLSVEQGKLFFYKNKQDLEHIDLIDLNHVQFVQTPDVLKSARGALNEEYQIVLIASGKTYYLLAESDKEMRKWLKGLLKWINFLNNADSLEKLNGKSPRKITELKSPLNFNLRRNTSAPIIDVKFALSKTSQPKGTLTPIDVRTENLNAKIKLLGDQILSQEEQNQNLTDQISNKNQSFEETKQKLQSEHIAKMNKLRQEFSEKTNQLDLLEEQIKQALETEEICVVMTDTKDGELTSLQKRVEEIFGRNSSENDRLLKELSSLKKRYFFALAFGFKTLLQNKKFNLESLYQKVEEQRIGYENWQVWLEKQVFEFN
eukprot:TRINITY_DN3156_c0_g1_i1.p1 TRINITY_DN3156_c0_g1~~TRINITY_DN3156_c0_g1_i1.p1  ORF type:complete len:350 (-),score=53.88 TRINITY_DN3156_c0_g1_i1:37-1086(-)